MARLELEVITLRYLLNNLIIYNHEVNRKLDLILEVTAISNSPYSQKNLLPKSRPKPKTVESDIKFDLFTLTELQYQKLLDKYGLDITIECCVELDEFIRLKGYCPYKTPYQAIEKTIANKVLGRKVIKSKEIKESIVKKIRYADIETKEDALLFIESIPEYVRNIDDRVLKLKERFEI